MSVPVEMTGKGNVLQVLGIHQDGARNDVAVDIPEPFD
jgi:hypothetical protein